MSEPKSMALNINFVKFVKNNPAFFQQFQLTKRYWYDISALLFAGSKEPILTQTASVASFTRNKPTAKYGQQYAML